MCVVSNSAFPGQNTRGDAEPGRVRARRRAVRVLGRRREREAWQWSARDGRPEFDHQDARLAHRPPPPPAGAPFPGDDQGQDTPTATPPYMRKMVFYPPRGWRYDTSVPVRCSASDLELELRGPAGCPAASRLGGGTTAGIIYEPLANAFEFTGYKNSFDIFNDTGEQVMVLQAGDFGYVVVRGRIGADQSVTYESPTCFPSPPAGQKCLRDYILQLKSQSSMPAYIKGSRSYARTPPKCPARGYWRGTVKFWWADGSIDTVATDQRCKRKR